MRDDDDIDGAGEAPPPEGEGTGGLLSTVVGAILCIGIVSGGAYWATGLGERQAASLPVFRAEHRPAKVRPADPGGAETPYMTVRSYEVAVGGGPAAPGETGLAPPPAEPTAEDVAMAELSTAVSEASAATVPGPPPRPEDAGAEQPDGAPPSAPEDAASQRAVDEAAQLAARAALSPVQIQLGAFTDRAFTESEWRRIADENPDLLRGRALAIQSTVAEGTKWFRLRVGPFRDRDEAAAVCDRLNARGQDCLVTTNG